MRQTVKALGVGLTLLGSGTLCEAATRALIPSDSQAQATLMAQRPAAGAAENLAYAELVTAAQKGDEQAQHELARRLRHGSPADRAQALEWFRRAAEQGVPEAQYMVGLAYYEGTVVKKDVKLALLFINRAAAQGDEDALNVLGNLHMEGEGMPVDQRKGVALYQAAARGGSVEAMVSLGRAYRKGEGVPQDFRKALSYYELAAALGSTQGQVMAGLMYQYGRGVPRNVERARQRFSAAAAQGDVHAAKFLRDLK